jgi:hypothetical protein
MDEATKKGTYYPTVSNKRFQGTSAMGLKSPRFWMQDAAAAAAAAFYICIRGRRFTNFQSELRKYLQIGHDCLLPIPLLLTILDYLPISFNYM